MAEVLQSNPRMSAAYNVGAVQRLALERDGAAIAGWSRLERRAWDLSFEQCKKGSGYSAVWPRRAFRNVGRRFRVGDSIVDGVIRVHALSQKVHIYTPLLFTFRAHHTHSKCRTAAAGAGC